MKPNILQRQALVNLRAVKQNKATVVLPSGTGKTFLACLWFWEKLKTNKEARLLYICHNEEILLQARDREFKKFFKGLSYGFFSSREKQTYRKQIVFATVQSLARNLDRFKPREFDYIIVDEAHHYRAITYEKVLTFFKPLFMLSLTATPYRNDGKNLSDVCGELIYEVNMDDAINFNLLSNIEYHFIQNNIDFSGVKWNGKSYNSVDLNKKICIPQYDKAILKSYLETVKKHKRKKTIAFCPTIEHALRMAKIFSKRGINAEAIVSDSTRGGHIVGQHRSLRRKLVEEFYDNNIDIVFTVNIFNEGVDFPEVDLVMLLRPTMSNIVFKQQIGRGLRKSKNKDYTMILDFVGNAHNNHLGILEDIVGTDLEAEAFKLISKRLEIREVVIIRGNFKIILSASKLDILQKQYKGWDKNRLFLEYNRLKRVLGRTPKYADFVTVKAKNKNKKALVSYNTLVKHFGTWINFFNQVEGLSLPKKSYKYDWKEVDKEYLRAMKELGRHPNSDELRRHKNAEKNIMSLPSHTGFIRKFKGMVNARDYYDKLSGKEYPRTKDGLRRGLNKK